MLNELLYQVNRVLGEEILRGLTRGHGGEKLLLYVLGQDEVLLKVQLV